LVFARFSHTSQEGFLERVSGPSFLFSLPKRGVFDHVHFNLDFPPLFTAKMMLKKFPKPDDPGFPFGYSKSQKVLACPSLEFCFCKVRKNFYYLFFSQELPHFVKKSFPGAPPYPLIKKLPPSDLVFPFRV